MDLDAELGDLDAGVGRVGETYLREQAQGRPMDLLDAFLRERLEPPADHARANRSQVVRQGVRALGSTRVATRGPA